MVRGFRRCRAAGALLACAVSLQATGAVQLFASAPAVMSCCRHDKSQVCHCPACTHARELGSNQRFIQTCAGATEPGLVVVQVAPALPQPGLQLPVAALAALPISPAPPGAPSPDREVPTPPPLVSRRG